MAAYKIVFDRASCIGAAECAALSPGFWKMQGDSKAALAGAKQNPKTGKFELVIDEAQVAGQKDVANSCPAGCISVEKC
jgi:ferredoxin